MAAHLIINIGTQNTYLAIKEFGAHKLPKLLQKLKTEVSVPLKLDPHATTPRTTIPFFTRYLGRQFQDPIIQKDIKSETNMVSPYKLVRTADGASTMIQLPSGVTYSPSLLLQSLMSKAGKIAESELGYVVDNYVLTFPSKVRTAQMVEVMNASNAALGGSDSLIYMVNEFTAAVTAYGLHGENGLYAVIDMGARSLDFTLFQVTLKKENESRDVDDNAALLISSGPKGREFKVIGNEIKTDMFLGGVEFDYVVAKFLVSEFKKSEGIDLGKNDLVIESLMEAAEKAKIELSESFETEINVPVLTIDAAGGTKGLKVVLTRSKFEALAEPLVERIMRYFESHLKDVGVKVKDVNRVVLVGGMANVPMVKTAVTRVFGRKPVEGMNPEEVVALGAAAAIEAGTLGLHPDSLPLDMCLGRMK